MGGHGGLNILPQKRWNVYNFDNREKVRKDEEAAAREEQLKLEQSRRQDFEFRLQKLRESRNLPQPQAPPTNPSTSNHINLFENSTDFSSLASDHVSKKPLKEQKVDLESGGGGKRTKREEKAVVVTAEDEKYRLGYGLAGKGVKAPWYLSKSSADFEEERVKGDGGDGSKKKSGGKKSIEELREERMRRERKEKERERALLRQGKGFSRRRM